jgi:hypothetical protein
VEPRLGYRTGRDRPGSAPRVTGRSAVAPPPIAHRGVAGRVRPEARGSRSGLRRPHTARGRRGSRGTREHADPGVGAHGSLVAPVVSSDPLRVIRFVPGPPRGGLPPWRDHPRIPGPSGPQRSDRELSVDGWSVKGGSQVEGHGAGAGSGIRERTAAVRSRVDSTARFRAIGLRHRRPPTTSPLRRPQEVTERGAPCAGRCR